MSATAPFSPTSIPSKINPASETPWLFAGMILTPIRLVTGFLFFSAFWRRMVDAPDKMNPETMGYVGEKFNHFLPHAIFGQKQLLEYLLLNPSVLHVFLLVFTILEGLCGLGLLTGTLTRLSALGITLMSWGVLTGSGWIGTTCLDEWQIGVLGMSGGMLVMAGGAGPWAIDHLARKKFPELFSKQWVAAITSGPLFSAHQRRWKFAYAFAAMVMMVITMATYQAFFNGLWGDLTNHSVKPFIEMADGKVTPGEQTLKFRLFRTGGPDTYGAFVIKASLKDQAGNDMVAWDSTAMASIPAADIQNKYIVKVRSHENSLLVPLGGWADMTLRHADLATLPAGTYTLELEDISGAKWKTPVKL